MSLFPYSSGPFYSRRTLWPSIPIFGGHRLEDPLERALDHFFDESMDMQLRDHSAQLNISDQGDLTYKVDVSGFRPEELKVELQGNELLIQGEHREKNHGESVHRQFTRRVLLPDSVKHETIKCDLDAGGRLCIVGKSAAGDGEQSRPIPIEMKKGGEQKKIKH